MSSLFHSLFKLQLRSSNKPTEDFLTEIFAFCIDDNRKLLKDFLIKFNIHDGDFKSARVTTQYTFSALDSHDTDSRPDIIIFLDTRVVLIENKIGSKEGNKQLARYAEHLDRFTLPKSLVYITRDYDPKEQKHILKDCQDKSIVFTQTRWFDIYVLLQKYNSDPIIFQLIEFMKELGLSSSKQFYPTDIIALNGFNKVRRMMEETMYGEVSSRFAELTKDISKPKYVMDQMRNHDRYIYYAWQNSHMWVGLGYWFNTNNEKQYPDLCFRLEVSPKSDKRDIIVSNFKKIIEAYPNEWVGFKLHDSSSWASINLITGMHNFLRGDDHVQNIKKHFMECLDKFEEIKRKYPELPWKK